MTLYLARRVVDGVVDDTSTVHLGRCDEDGCRYLADSALPEVVEDALDGHRRRAHAATTVRSEDVTRTGFIPAWHYGPDPDSDTPKPPPATGLPPTWAYGPIADSDAAEPSNTPPWSPSPTRREGDPS